MDYLLFRGAIPSNVPQILVIRGGASLVNDALCKTAGWNNSDPGVIMIATIDAATGTVRSIRFATRGVLGPTCGSRPEKVRRHDGHTKEDKLSCF